LDCLGAGFEIEEADRIPSAGAEASALDMFSAITISLVPEARGGPFVLWDGLERGCEEAAALGFDAVELFPPAAEAVNARQLKLLLQSRQLKLAGVGTGAGWVAHKLRLTDADPAVRTRARDFAFAIIDLAGEFVAPAIIGSMQGRCEGNVNRDRALNWLAEALEELAPRAASFGVPVLLEPLNRYETNLLNCVSDTLAFLGRLRTQNVRILGDLFHMNIEEPDVAEALRRAGPKLGHVHFADSNRHAIGFGHTDMAPVARALREIEFEGCISAEVLPLPDSHTAAVQTIQSYRRFFQARAGGMPRRP
jgi:sugar phosphate isomerase/epimerase